ncbi:MAG TPA: lysylphosphatidylglycerol synthase transmembrane domain-containing protein, partial [Solirubrobacteraceae bacterium]|nr:lysylphosphatidylglycerol synthase transmembrane domain-containing protein [Solirubrobacteraceae bacterium]
NASAGDDDDPSRSNASGDDDEEDASSDEGISLDRRKALIALVVAVLLAGGAITGFGQLAHLGRLERAVRQADKLWFIPCLIGQLLAYVGYILAYHDAARADGGPRFNYRTTAQIVIFGAGASVLGASVGGLAVDYWALRRTGTEPHVASRRVLGVGTIEWTVLSIYAWSTALLVLVFALHAPVGMALGWLFAVPACVGGAMWFTSPRRVERYVNPEQRPVQPEHNRIVRVLIKVENKLRTGLDDGIAGVIFVRHLISHPLRYLGGTIGYPIYWAGDMLTLYAAVRGFGGDPNVIALILAYATSFVISALPLPAGGAGGIEATITLSLHAIGIPFATAVLAVLVYRLITFWLPVIPALALLPRMRRLHETLPSVPHTQRDSDEEISFRPAHSSQ